MNDHYLPVRRGTRKDVLVVDGVKATSSTGVSASRTSGRSSGFSGSVIYHITRSTASIRILVEILEGVISTIEDETRAHEIL